MKRILGLAVVLTVALVGQAGAASPEQRWALIIGNDDYRHAQVAKLANASNDARSMDQALRRAGFSTILKINATRRETYQSINEFAGKLSPGSVGLAYYAGHGIQASGHNYLVPVDAEIDSEDDLEAEAVDVGKIVQAMGEAHSALNIIVLDACRDNPLPKARSMMRGLARIDAPRGTFIAYAAGPGQVAQDGKPGGNGIFTGELVRAIDAPGLKIEDVFKRVTAGVLEQTGNKQTPWTEASLQTDFYFHAPQPVAPPPAVVQAPPPPLPVAPADHSVELAFWDAIKTSEFPSDFEAYLQKYPQGDFVVLAKSRLERLKGQSKLASAAPTASEPTPDRTMTQRPPAPPAPVAPPAPTVTLAAVTPPPPQALAPPASATKEPEMINLRGGTFTMGSNEDPSEKPVHKVTVAPFALAKAPVSVGEWRQCVEAQGCPTVPNSGSEDEEPVRNVSWADTQRYIAWLSKAANKTYRLPSEAEFEYAARGGTTTKWWWGNAVKDGVADCKGCGGVYNAKAPAKPISLQPNPMGLVGMSGSVDEWVADCWHKDYRGAPADGSAWVEENCSDRVLRGGSWKSEPGAVRSSARDQYDAPVRYFTHGFRVARSQE